MSNNTTNIEKHIEIVGNTIDIVCENLTPNDNYNNEINNLTLIDLIQYFANDSMLPNYDILSNINNNTYMNLGYARSDNFLKYFITELEIRKKLHDRDILNKLTSKTPTLEQLDYHYGNCRHHPEYFPLGIRNMNISDLTEMFCDWYSICKQNEEDIYKLIETNQDKYKYGKTLTRILSNTVDKYFDK